MEYANPGVRILSFGVQGAFFGRTELILHIRAFQDSVETRQPDLACALVDFETDVSCSHAWRSVLLHVKSRPPEQSHKELGGFLRSLLHVGWRQRPDFGLLRLTIKIRHHLKILASHII